MKSVILYISVTVNLWLSITSALNAQQTEWVKQLGSQTANAVTLDDSSNVYTTGVFIGNADFDPGSAVCILPHHPTGNNTYISKLDSLGNFVWASSIQGADVIAWGIATDHNKNVYISGLFYSTADFDPDSTSVYSMTATNYMNGNPDIFLLKLNRNGKFVWAKKIGSSDFESSGNMVMDENDNIYLAGRFSNTLDFDPGPGIFNLSPSFSNEEAYVAKFDTAGNFHWALSAQLSYYGEFEPLAETYDHNGNIFVGNFGEIAKIDTAGNYLFKKQFNNNPITTNLLFNINSLSCNSYGDVFTAGDFSDTVDIDPDTSNASYLYANTSENTFVCKLNTSLQLQWSKSFKASGTYSSNSSINLAYSINAGNNNDIYIGGLFADTLDIDSGAYYLFENNPDTSNQFWDAYLVDLDQQGNFKWARSFGGNAYDRLCRIIADSNRVIIAGDFSDTADFDPGPVNQTLMFNGLGNSNVFLVKIVQTVTGLEKINTEMHMTIYPNPAHYSLTLNTDEKEIQEIEVYNVLGKRLLIFKNNNSFHAKINVSYLPAGMYLLKVETNEGNITTKFLKQ